MRLLKSKKAFTIIELIVVMAVIGILVLMAGPKLLGYTEKAQMARIRHDVRVMEEEMETQLIEKERTFKTWDDNLKDLEFLAMQKKLYERKGFAKSVEKPFVGSGNSSFKVRSLPGGVGGPLVTLGGEEASPESEADYKIIPEELERKIKTRLPGTFYANEQGRVYYEHDRPLTGGKTDSDNDNNACMAPDPLPQYEFDHETGTIVKFNNVYGVFHLTIPSAFNVDGKCYPVLIIGKGAFMNGGYKEIVIPDSVKEIEDDAFKGNDLEKIEIPGSVTEVAPGAFDDNKFTPGNPPIYKGPSDKVNGGNGLPPVVNQSGESIPWVNENPTAGESGLVFDKETGAIVGNTGSGGSNRPGSSGGSSGSGGSGSSGGSGGSSGSGSSRGSWGSGGGSVYIPPFIKDPNTGKEYPVEEVQKGAFQGEGLISVGLPEGLKRIEAYAFAGNQLWGVEIPQSVEFIGRYAFAFNEVNYVSPSGKVLKTEPTLKFIKVQNKEWINSLGKYGDIEESGKKIDIMKHNTLPNSQTTLENQIWVTSVGQEIIEPEWDKSEEKDTARENLQEKINKVKDYKEENYKEGWADFSNALESAIKVAGKSSSTQKQIESALVNLESAIENLVKNKPPTPGGNIPIGEANGVTFYGEVSSGQLISGDTLASKLRFSAGKSHNSNAGWLKFEVKEGNTTKILFVAKKTFRHTFYWRDLYGTGAIYGDGGPGGDRTVEINGITYRVRLLRTLDPQKYPNPRTDGAPTYFGDFNHNGEWNKLMLPIHEKSISKNWRLPQNVESNLGSIPHTYGTGKNSMYSDGDLGIASSNGVVSYTITQDIYYFINEVRIASRGNSWVSSSTNTVGRGSNGYGSSTEGACRNGWRPVLEVVY